MSKYSHDLVATVGEYQVNGETKKRYQKCGIAFTDDEGRLSLKLEAIPVTPDWNGWVSLYPKKEYDTPRPQQQPVATSEPSDDIPF